MCTKDSSGNLPFLYLTLKSSRDDFNVLDNFNVSSIKTAIAFTVLSLGYERFRARIG